MKVFPLLETDIQDHLEKLFKEPKLYDEFMNYEDAKNVAASKIITHLQSSDNILELGPGTGKQTFLIAKKVKKLYALDNSKEMIAFLDDKIKEKKIRNIQTIQSSYNTIPLPDDSIDAVFSVWSFPSHSLDGEQDLKEVRRVLKKKGIIILIDTYPDGEYYELKKEIQKDHLFKHQRAYKKKLEAWLLSNNFTYTVFDTSCDFKSKRNVETSGSVFFGKEFSEHLLRKNRTKFAMKLYLFVGGK